jgi:hypothetical protein
LADEPPLPPEAEAPAPVAAAPDADPLVVTPAELTARRPLEIDEAVTQFDDDGVNAAVVGVTVVPTVNGTGVPSLV